MKVVTIILYVGELYKSRVLDSEEGKIANEPYREAQDLQ